MQNFDPGSFDPVIIVIIIEGQPQNNPDFTLLMTCKILESPGKSRSPQVSGLLRHVIPILGTQWMSQVTHNQ